MMRLLRRPQALHSAAKAGAGSAGRGRSADLPSSNLRTSSGPLAAMMDSV